MPDTPQSRTAVILAGAVFLLVLGLGAVLMVTAPGRLESGLGSAGGPPPPAEAGEPGGEQEEPAPSAEEAEPGAGTPADAALGGADGAAGNAPGEEEAARGEPAAPAPVEALPEEEAEEEYDPTLPPPGTVQLARPDVETLYEYITEGDPRRHWPLFPGSERQFSGHHGQVLSMRVNRSAEQALKSGERIPHGGSLVLDVFDGLGQPIETYVMSRWDGLDPKNDDWLYARFDREGRAIRFGKVVPCIECHMEEPTTGGILRPRAPTKAKPEASEQPEPPQPGEPPSPDPKDQEQPGL